MREGRMIGGRKNESCSPSLFTTSTELKEGRKVGRLSRGGSK